MKNLLIITVLFVLLTACLAGRNFPKNDTENVNIENVRHINGFYENYEKSGKYYCYNSIWENIMPFDKDSIASTPNSVVKIEVNKNGTVLFVLYTDGIPRKTKVLSYEIVEENLICNKNWESEGVPLLFFRYHKENLTLSIDNENNLIMKTDGKVLGGLFIIIFGEDINSTLKFNRK